MLSLFNVAMGCSYATRVLDLHVDTGFTITVVDIATAAVGCSATLVFMGFTLVLSVTTPKDPRGRDVATTPPPAPPAPLMPNYQVSREGYDTDIRGSIANFRAPGIVCVTIPLPTKDPS